MLITRSGCFGKTLTLTTFYDFLSLNPMYPGDISRRERWFRDTAIYKDQEFCRNYMGKFPVIFISLKGVSGNDFTGAYRQLASTIYDVYCRFRYLGKSDKLDDDERENFKSYLDPRYLEYFNNNNA